MAEAGRIPRGSGGVGGTSDCELRGKGSRNNADARGRGKAGERIEDCKDAKGARFSDGELVEVGLVYTVVEGPAEVGAPLVAVPVSANVGAVPLTPENWLVSVNLEAHPDAREAIGGLIPGETRMWYDEGGTWTAVLSVTQEAGEPHVTPSSGDSADERIEYLRQSLATVAFCRTPRVWAILVEIVDIAGEDRRPNASRYCRKWR